MALTEINSKGIKDADIATVDIADDAVTSAKIADDAVVQAAIADESVDEARLQISNAGSNGQFLSKQSGNTGGLTWATVDTSIADDSIVEAKLDIHAAPSGTDKVLGYTSNGMEWVVSSAGATGGGTEKIFWENGTTIDTNYTVGTSFGAACNAMSAGPITINTGKIVTIDAGDTWTIV